MSEITFLDTSKTDDIVFLDARNTEPVSRPNSGPRVDLEKKMNRKFAMEIILVPIIIAALAVGMMARWKHNQSTRDGQPETAVDWNVLEAADKNAAAATKLESREVFDSNPDSGIFMLIYTREGSQYPVVDL